MAKEIVDFKEEKAKKNGEYTPKQLIEDLLKNKDKTKTIVAVQLLEDETIIASWSNTHSTKVIGLLEVGKDQVLEDMQGL